MSGDGTWTGSATGQDGQVNEEFVFPWPADWIGTIDTQSTDWTWQAEQWSTPTVAAALAARYDEMYATLNAHVKELDGLQFSLEKDGSGRTVIKHAPAVAQQVPRVGAFNHAHYINIPLALHISDRDYYSIPEWNHEFARRITSASGASKVYIYPGTNHALRASEHAWFSPPGTLDGVPTALARDRHLFRGQGMPD